MPVLDWNEWRYSLEYALSAISRSLESQLSGDGTSRHAIVWFEFLSSTLTFLSYGPVADAYEWQLTGCLNFLSEIALNLTGTNGSIVPVTVGHGLKKQSLKLVDGNQ